MHKLPLLLATLALYALASSAQAQTVKTKAKPMTSAAAKTVPTPTPAAATLAPATAYADYVGFYEMENFPFDGVTVSVENGKLLSKAGDNSALLTPGKAVDTFESGQSIFTFKRDANKQVVSLSLEAQGVTFEGAKKK